MVHNVVQNGNDIVDDEDDDVTEFERTKPDTASGCVKVLVHVGVAEVGSLMVQNLTV